MEPILTYIKQVLNVLSIQNKYLSQRIHLNTYLKKTNGNLTIWSLLLSLLPPVSPPPIYLHSSSPSSFPHFAV